MTKKQTPADTNYTSNLFFFDSWGGLHASCDGDHPKAEAFGPTGVSRPVVFGELDALGLRGDSTPMVLAEETGRVIEATQPHEFALLKA